MSSVETIMRRFRPIAPKPTVDGGATVVDVGSTIRSSRRGGKRRGSVGRCNSGKKVTLSLLPDERKLDNSPTSGSSSNNSNGSSDPAVWWNFGSADDVNVKRAPVTMPMTMPVTVVGSMVTVECVMETWGGDVLYGLGNTDDEKMVRLDMDACPGFISDGGCRVLWTNGAYREMVGQNHHDYDDGDGDDGVRVLLSMNKEKVGDLLEYGRVFSCRVRMQYLRGKDRCSLTLPCDVWRMDFGGYAWRLDVMAALCLGR